VPSLGKAWPPAKGPLCAAREYPHGQRVAFIFDEANAASSFAVTASRGFTLPFVVCSKANLRCSCRRSNRGASLVRRRKLECNGPLVSGQAGTEVALGELVSTHAYTLRSRLLMLGVGSVTTLGGPLLGAGPFVFPDPRLGAGAWFFPLMGLPVTLFGVGILRAFARTRGRVIALYRAGVVETLPGRREVFRFDAVESIRSERVELRQAVGLVRTRAETHTLRLFDGKSLLVNHLVCDIQSLGRALEERVAERVVARVRTRLAENAKVPFGPVTLTGSAVEVNGHGAMYAELANVEVEDGRIRFFKRGAPRAWQSVGYGRVLNAQALLAIVRERIAPPRA
jgi:hypothetical protein